MSVVMWGSNISWALTVGLGYYDPHIQVSLSEEELQLKDSIPTVTLVKEAVGSEWSTFRGERTAGIDKIKELRLRIADEDARRKKEKTDEIEADEKKIKSTRTKK
ncbi:hypothetical protein BDR06DRAFT_998387 [Suillus hirtellus]|nr:hypothetical protein BDR06DRAFT_998387 [Suillus hirtellus]